tara:strand:+ start:821 stop:1174 length:354 start_codon:yes stop_codon:yes gene_type:complete
MSSGSKKIVVVGIVSNALVTIIKFISAFVASSASMMNEAIHSMMDTLNQVFLLFGLIAGGKQPDQDYAFGHHQKKFIWNLWSAIGLFSQLAQGWVFITPITHTLPWEMLKLKSILLI